MYITIEGPEYCGKSTQARLLAEKLSLNGYSVLLTKEPGSPHDHVCQNIRSLLLNPEYVIDKTAALFLFLADRAQHVQTIKQAISEKKIVISDRSSLSSFVYHTAECRDFINVENDLMLARMCDTAQQLAPDLCFICSSDLNWALNGLKKRANLDRIERFSVEFHSRTHKLFEIENITKICTLMQNSPKQVLMVPAASSSHKEIVSEFILARAIEALNAAS